MISNERYLAFQKRLADQKFFRRFWRFSAIYSVIFILLVSVYFWEIGSGKVVLLAFVSFVLARLIISPLISAFYKKERPYQVLKFDPIQSILFSFKTQRPNSFPSGHAISFASICTVFYYFFPNFGIALIIVMFINGMGRIILGYHYMVDILAGWIVGIFAAFITIYWLMPILFTK